MKPSQRIIEAFPARPGKKDPYAELLHELLKLQQELLVLESESREIIDKGRRTPPYERGEPHTLSWSAAVRDASPAGKTGSGRTIVNGMRGATRSEQLESDYRSVAARARETIAADATFAG